MEVQIAVAKTRKYAVTASGDTVEVVERPQGGISVVLADGQSSGKGAKWISTLVVRKVITLLAEGVRDGAAARAASDSLFTDRGGKVSATLNIISVDQQSKTLVMTRNNPVPAYIVIQGSLKSIDETSLPIGLYRDTRPVITEIPLEAGLIAIAFSDGLVHAGERSGENLNIAGMLTDLIQDEAPSAELIADTLLESALRLDQHRPGDDISVAVVQVIKHSGDEVRRMAVRLPLNS